MFKVEKRLKNGLGRVGTITTPHGDIQTPAFIAVGTKATVKSLSPDQIKEAGSQAVLANTYHLFLQPGEKLIAEHGGLRKFMNWQGPTFTDSGGFQAFSLGVAFGHGLGKFISADTPEPEILEEIKDARHGKAVGKKAKVTEEGVEFASIIDGSMHFLSPERSIQVQHDIGADIIFALDEFTSPHADHEQIKATIERTERWARRCLDEHSPTRTLPKGEGNPRFHTADKSIYTMLQPRALEMRKNPTQAESILWERIKNDATGYRIRRQYVVGTFIVDFVCLEKKLAIEVDGDIHGYQIERDEERTNQLEQLGFSIIRFKNEEILSNREAVFGKLLDALKALPYGEGLGGAQALFGIVQGGRYEDLRKMSAKAISDLPFDGFGIGGTFVKEDMATAVRWVNESLPEDKPRHLLGVGEPIDIILGTENGCDTFDCVTPSRHGRNGTLFTKEGKINITNSEFRNKIAPIEEGCGCYTCRNYTAAYICHLQKSHEMLGGTLGTIHNLYFLNKLASDLREAILEDRFEEFKENFLNTYKI